MDGAEDDKGERTRDGAFQEMVAAFDPQADLQRLVVVVERAAHDLQREAIFQVQKKMVTSDRPQYLDLDIEVQRGSNQRAATVVDLHKAGSILGPTLGTHQRALHAVMEEGGVIPTP